MKTLALPFFAFALLASAPSFALEVGDSGPNVVLNDIQVNDGVVNQGIETRASGNTFVLLEFFSVTCSDCADNLPKLSSLAKAIEATTTTRLVGIDRDASAARTYVDAHRDLINFPAAVDSARAALKAYGVVETPTIFLLDAHNTIIYKHEGVFEESDITTIQQLVH